MNSNFNKSPDPHDASKCDLCGQRTESVRQRRVASIGLQSRRVQTKFCYECAHDATKWSPDELAILAEDDAKPSQMPNQSR
jgi:uncharacterized protein YlaI